MIPLELIYISLLSINTKKLIDFSIINNMLPNLGYNYKLLKNKFTSDYNFMFDTYLYPEDKNLIEKKFGNYTIKNNKEIWLIKPKFKSEGINITLLTNISDIILED